MQVRLIPVGVHTILSAPMLVLVSTPGNNSRADARFAITWSDWYDRLGLLGVLQPVPVTVQGLGN